MHMVARLRCALLLITIAALEVGCAERDTTSAPDIIEECMDWMERQPRMDQNEDQANFTAKGAGACISGYIDDDLHDTVFEWLDKVSPQTTPVVVIRSGGGDAFSAIDIAEELQKRDAAIYIYDVCASSCANYIYAGVRNRHSIGKTILLFHGGISEDTPQETAEVFDDLLNSPEGKYIENPALEREQWVKRAERYIKKQDKLLMAAGVDPVMIHGFKDMETSDLASADCDPAREPDLEYIAFFSEDTAKALGILPVTGSLEYRAGAINERLNRRTKGNKACLAPAKFFQPARQPRLAQ